MKVGIDGVLLGAWVDLTLASKIIDAGTGTGLIALMLAQRCSGMITAVEMDGEAALEARSNADHSPWGDRITIVHNTFQNFALDQTASFDLIVSNPPYFTSGTKPLHNQRAAARHNHQLPLPDLLSGCASILNTEGRIALVLPATDESALVRYADAAGFALLRITRVRPNPVKPFHRILVELSRNAPQILEDTLTIEGETHFDYTREYRELTRDFYPAF